MSEERFREINEKAATDMTATQKSKKERKTIIRPNSFGEAALNQSKIMDEILNYAFEKNKQGEGWMEEDFVGALELLLFIAKKKGFKLELLEIQTQHLLDK